MLTSPLISLKFLNRINVSAHAHPRIPGSSEERTRKHTHHRKWRTVWRVNRTGCRAAEDMFWTPPCPDKGPQCNFLPPHVIHQPASGQHDQDSPPGPFLDPLRSQRRGGVRGGIFPHLHAIIRNFSGPQPQPCRSHSTTQHTQRNGKRRADSNGEKERNYQTPSGTENRSEG